MIVFKCSRQFHGPFWCSQQEASQRVAQLIKEHKQRQTIQKPK
jgi:hypothetical protein